MIHLARVDAVEELEWRHPGGENSEMVADG